MRLNCACEICTIKRHSHALFSMLRTQDPDTIEKITAARRSHVRELLNRIKPTL